MIAFEDFVEKIKQVDYIKIYECNARRINIQILAESDNVSNYVISKIRSMDIQDCNIKTGNYSTMTICKYKDIPDIIDKAISYENMVEILKNENVNAELCHGTGGPKVKINVSYNCEKELMRLINIKENMNAYEEYGYIYITSEKCKKRHQRRQECKDNCLKAEFDELFELY